MDKLVENLKKNLKESKPMTQDEGKTKRRERSEFSISFEIDSFRTGSMIIVRFTTRTIGSVQFSSNQLEVSES